MSYIIRINSYFCFSPCCILIQWQPSLPSSPVAKVHIYICNGNISEPLLALHRLFIAHWWHNHYLFILIFLVNVTSEVQDRGLAVPRLNQFIKSSRKSHPPFRTSQMFCFHLIRQLIWPPVPQEKMLLPFIFILKDGKGMGQVISSTAGYRIKHSRKLPCVDFTS